MFKVIEDFPKQFSWPAKVNNAKNYRSKNKFIVLGMGGSHLAADILNHHLDKEIIVHHSYGLPKLSDKTLKDYTIIASSFSGNTEEVIDGLKLALQKKLSVAVLAVGGKLIKMAKEKNLAYVQMPDLGLQPRMGLGLQTKALLALMRENKVARDLKSLANTKTKTYQKQGQKLAKQLKNKVPIIYACHYYETLAYNWKIKFNEDTKIPAFYNTFPELNHNEMNGFDHVLSTKHLSEKFHFIFLKDKNDHPRINKRMQVLQKLLTQRKFPVTIIELKGKNIWEKMFTNLIIADFTAFYLAGHYGIDPEPVQMVEQFKKLIK
ncbi:hypothetical protein H6761_03435 [Candidatus Nomurabacteria bacterium]|nr:hypothetical protein [Candidatus Nomurabacteria bacterium]